MFNLSLGQPMSHLNRFMNYTLEGKKMTDVRKLNTLVDIQGLVQDSTDN